MTILLQLGRSNLHKNRRPLRSVLQEVAKLSVADGVLRRWRSRDREHPMESQKDGGKQCVRPPAVDELDLVAAADGEAGPDVLAHLAACDYCASRARSIASLQQTLQHRLFRAFCPPTDDLLAFYHRTLSEARYAAIASHLDECPHCAREMQLILYAAHEPPQVQMLSPTRRIVAQLLAPVASAGPHPPHGPLPSANGAAHYAYRADNLELTLRIARTAGRPGILAVSGRLALEDDLLEYEFEGATASLLADANLLAVAPLDEMGGFFFDAVPPGEYQLSVRLGACEVVVEALTV
jgi:hypothetical protein